MFDWDLNFFNISIYLWRHLLMLVVDTASLMLVDNAKQAGLVDCRGIYRSKSHPVAIFFEVENLVTYVDSPHQNVLRHSGLTIHALEILAITRNQTPDYQMAESA